MEEDIFSTLMSEISVDRTKQSQNMLAELDDGFEPVQFIEGSGLDVENLPVSEDQPPGSTSVPFVSLGKKDEEPRKVKVGLWQISSN